ncbi:MAG TPA: aldo/keto reductase [Dehalococcoidia bacterium]|nr:aldo/keto reductase [Dehalococcoidia bacterium]
MVEKVRLGKSELRVTPIGLGSIPIQRLNDEDAVRVVRRCLEHGINYIDTANAYSTSERRIGLVLRDWDGEVIVSTKSQSRTPDGIREHLDNSLRMLGVRAINLYQFHNVSTFADLENVLGPTGPYPVVEAARRNGEVEHIGITSHQIDVAKEAVKSGRFETIMYPLNFVAHEPGEELLQLASDHDVGFIAMKPFAGGMIASAPLAIKYLLQYPGVVAIPGVQSIAEIDEIMEIAKGSIELTAADRAEVERIRGELGNRFCRRCDYCQPCTAGIPISTVMAFSGMVRRMPISGVVSGWVADAMEKVVNCTNCGLCEERCPYGLPIREMMSENLENYRRLKSEFQASIS